MRASTSGLPIAAVLAALLAGSALAGPAQAQPAAPAEGAFTLRDNGVRCIRAPCPHYTATELGSGRSAAVAGFDLAPLGLAAAENEALAADLYDGLWIVQGRIEQRPPGPPALAETATVLVVSRVLRRVPGSARARARYRPPATR